jgi:hypothetical protein
MRRHARSDDTLTVSIRIFFCPTDTLTVSIRIFFCPTEKKKKYGQYGIRTRDLDNFDVVDFGFRFLADADVALYQLS